jgi:hypothetical protein
MIFQTVSLGCICHSTVGLASWIDSWLISCKAVCGLTDQSYGLFFFSIYLLNFLSIFSIFYNDSLSLSLSQLLDTKT